MMRSGRLTNLLLWAGSGFSTFPCLSHSAQAASPRLPPIFVSVEGNDSNSGATAGSAFRTLNRASDEITRQGGGTVVVAAGLYAITKPIVIQTTKYPQRWEGSVSAATVIDGQFTASSAIIVKANDVTIAGFNIRRFRQSGIIVNGGSAARIINNTIEDIKSDGWSQAAVIALQNAPNMVVSNNLIRRVRYAGIAAVASVRGNLQNLEISGNAIYSSCTAISDCGSIYVSGRTHLNGGKITDNRIEVLAPSSNLASAIYLDDLASNYDVIQNVISGNATAPFHVHGGQNINFIENDLCAGTFNVALKIQNRGGAAPQGIVFKRNKFCNATMVGQLNRAKFNRGTSLVVEDNQ